MPGNRQHALKDLLAWTARSTASQLESIVSFPLPFFRDSVLVCVADDLADANGFTAELFDRISPSLELFCLRRSEIYQLALPNPWEPQTLSLPFWIRHAGVVLLGIDIRPAVPVHRDYSRVFANYLEITTHRIRNQFILELLVRKEYETLQSGLDRHRRLLMMVALLAKGIWRVHPSTVDVQFLEAHPRDAFRSNLAAAGEARVGLNHSANLQGTLAYRSVWLFECFLRELWKEC